MDEDKAVLGSERGVRIHSASDIADALSACYGAAGLVLTESELDDAFFDLRTGLAGEVMQGFVNYRKRLALVIPDVGRYGERLAELAYEHRIHPNVRFVATVGEAVTWLEG